MRENIWYTVSIISQSVFNQLSDCAPWQFKKRLYIDAELWYNINRYCVIRRCKEVDAVTREELINSEVDNFARLQEIKQANGGHENKKLDYEIKLSIAKLSTFGMSVEDITL